MAYLVPLSISSLFLIFSWSLFSRTAIKTENILLLLLITYVIFFNKLYSISIVPIILIFAMVVLLEKKEPLKDKFTSRVILFFAFWSIYAVVQYFVSFNRSYSYVTALIIDATLVIMMIFYATSNGRIAKIYIHWSIGTFILILIGWWEIITGNHLQTSGATMYNIANVATSTFYNPNDFAYFLIVSMPIIFYVILQRSIVLKISGCFMFVSAVYFIYLSSARMVMILLAISLLGLIYYLVRQKKSIVIFAMFALFIFLSFYFSTVTIDGINQVMSLDTTHDESSIIRKNLIIGAFDVFKDHPLGVGSGNIELHMPYYAENVYGLVNVHNMWLEILANYGFIIFTLFVLIMIISLVKLWFAFNRSKENRIYIFPVFLSLILFIPACIESSSAFQMPFTWFFIGIVLSSARVFSKSVSTRSPSNSNKPTLTMFQPLPYTHQNMKP